MTLKPALSAVFVMLLAMPAMADESAQGAAELQKCKICHSLDNGGPNRVGPNLYGVFGRKAGTVSGFNYSDAMKNSGIVWDDDSLAKFLRGPQEAMPGNHMSFPGVKDEAALTDLLKQLKQATQ
jgi:cytochrome c